MSCLVVLWFQVLGPKLKCKNNFSSFCRTTASTKFWPDNCIYVDNHSKLLLKIKVALNCKLLLYRKKTVIHIPPFQLKWKTCRSLEMWVLVFLVTSQEEKHVVKSYVLLWKCTCQRVSQLLVNVSLEKEICPCCCVLLEQALFKN